jgi:hypothetical protein
MFTLTSIAAGLPLLTRLRAPTSPFHGDLMVVKPNHGRLLRINLSGKHEPRIEQLTDFSAPLGHQVPTSLASRDARFYIGNLFHFPIVAGSSKLYQVTRDGFVVDYWGGFHDRCRR